MTGPPSSHRSALGRADLLRVLAVAAPETVALDRDDTGWFGYVHAQAPADTDPVPFAGTSPPGPAEPDAAPTVRLPLQMPATWTIVQRSSHPQPPEDRRPPPQADRPLTLADVQPVEKQRLVGYEDLVPPARLLPALRRHLGSSRAGPLDLARILDHVAAGRVPRRLSRTRRSCWHPDLVVVLDFSLRLWPYRADLHRLAGRLARLCGESCLSLRILERGPDGPWSDWLAHQNPLSPSRPPDRPWRMPAPGTPVLIAGDLGRLLGAHAPLAEAWTDFVDNLLRAQTRPLALVPLGAGQVDATLATRLPVLRWSPDAPPHPTRGTGSPRARPPGLDTLLALVAACRRVDPPLLRALRRIAPTAPLDAGLEGAVWTHSDVQADTTAALRHARQAPHLARFQALTPALQTDQDQLRQRHHAHLPTLLEAEETLLWWSQAAPQLRRTEPAQTRRDAAEALFAQLEQTLADPTRPDDPAVDWLWVTESLLRRAEGTSLGRDFPVLRRLAHRLGTVLGDPALAEWGEAVPVWIVQDAESGHLRAQTEPAGPRQSPLGAPLAVDQAGLGLTGTGFAPGSRLLRRELPATLAPLDPPVPLRLEASGETVELAPVARPRGLGGWGWTRDGLALESPPLAGKTVRWTADQLSFVRPDGAPEAKLEAPVRALAIDAPGSAKPTVRLGIDAAFGVYADLILPSRDGPAQQRFRWIEPDTFRMGSPPDENGRFDNEGPQHPVTLTRGVWLADSACSQAVWQAVIGNNPSHFKGPDRPVEQVNWHDVQTFLRRFESLLPGCAADLPTEAEWEFACRAGTRTAFSFGDTVTRAQVNFGGGDTITGAQVNFGGGETVPVRSLPPNPWGLYEMHGNVWEWCADERRRYEDTAEIDPHGPGGLDSPGAHRVFRGGSWIVAARLARSAYRHAFGPGGRFDALGFRLCLRSIQPGTDRGPIQAGPQASPEGGKRAGRARKKP